MVDTSVQHRDPDGKQFPHQEIRSHGRDRDERSAAVAWSPDGRSLAIGSDGLAQIVEAATGKVFSRMAQGHSVLAVAWSPDGRSLAIGLYNGSARVFEVHSDREISKTEHGSPVTAVAWSSDGRWLAVGLGDASLLGEESGMARVVNAVTGTEVTRLTHDIPVVAVAWSADGRLLATGSQGSIFFKSSGSARIFDVATSSEVARVAQGRSVYSVAWSPVSPAVLTGSADGTARLWRVFLTDEALVTAAKNRAARCLTQKQRQQFFLSAAPPTWCVERRLWPYHGDDWRAWLPLRKTWLANERQGPEPMLPKEG